MLIGDGLKFIVIYGVFQLLSTQLTLVFAGCVMQSEKNEMDAAGIEEKKEVGRRTVIFVDVFLCIASLTFYLYLRCNTRTFPQVDMNDPDRVWHPSVSTKTYSNSSSNFVVFVMAPPLDLMDDRDLWLLNRTLISSKEYGYETILHHNNNYEPGGFVDSFKYMSSFAPEKVLVMLQHSAPLIKPLHELRCDFETANTALHQSKGIDTKHMKWSSRILARSLNVSCGSPCSGPRLKHHIPEWHCFRDAVFVMSPLARRLLEMVALTLERDIEKRNITKENAMEFERMGGIMSAYVCSITSNCNYEHNCQQRVVQKIHGRIN